MSNTASAQTLDAAARRQAIRSAIRDVPGHMNEFVRLREAGVIKAHRAKVNDLETGELLSLCVALGIDVKTTMAAALAAAPAAPAPAALAVVPVAPESVEDGDGEPAGSGDALAMAEAALEPLRPFLPVLAGEIVADLKARVAALADKAAAPPTIIHVAAAPGSNVVTLPAPAVPAKPLPRIVGTQPASSVFGLRHAWARGFNVDMWNAPDAPAVDADFLWSPDALQDVLACVRSGRPVWLHGPRGTGKTSFAMNFAAATGRSFTRIAFDRYTEPVELIGSPALAKDGGMTFREGALTAAIQVPGNVILLDEPTAAVPCHFALQTLLDFGFLTLKEDGGRVVRMARGVVIIAADNTSGAGDATGQYVGTGIANAAFRDRFAAMVEMGYLPVPVETEALRTRTGCPVDLARFMVNFADVTRVAAQTGKLASGIGFRRLRDFVDGVMAGVPVDRAFVSRVVAHAGPEDATTLLELQKAKLPFADVERFATGAPAPAPASQATVLDPTAQARAKARFDDAPETL